MKLLLFTLAALSLSSQTMASTAYQCQPTENPSILIFLEFESGMSQVHRQMKVWARDNYMTAQGKCFSVDSPYLNPPAGWHCQGFWALTGEPLNLSLSSTFPSPAISILKRPARTTDGSRIELRCRKTSLRLN